MKERNRRERKRKAEWGERRRQEGLGRVEREREREREKRPARRLQQYKRGWHEGSLHVVILTEVYDISPNKPSVNGYRLQLGEGCCCCCCCCCFVCRVGEEEPEVG